MSTPDAAEAARDRLRHAHALHAEGRIDEALAEARAAIELAPTLIDAWTYVGTTLVTRKLAYREGIEALEHAFELAPDDPGVNYSLGWTYEFVAYRLEKQATKPYRDPLDLYELAAERLRRTIELNPEQKLIEDAEDLLASVEDRL